MVDLAFSAAEQAGISFLTPDGVGSITRAAAATWEIEHQDVILLDDQARGNADLRALFAGLGLDVYHGAHHPDICGAPLIVLSAAALGDPEVAVRLRACRARFPDAALCVITGRPGTAVALSRLPDGDDARKALHGAGIGFVSMKEH